MKIQKVVRIEVTTADCGNTEVNIIFGLEGAITSYFYVGCVVAHRLFTETNRISLSFREGYDLRHFDGWTVPAPRLHPTDDILKVVTEACYKTAGWASEDDQTLDGWVPRQGSFQSQKLES